MRGREAAVNLLLLVHLLAQPVHASLVLVHTCTQLDDDVLALRELFGERRVPVNEREGGGCE